VSGFWHGANWTFIAWGLFNALLFLPLMLTGRNQKHTGTVAEGRLLPSVREAFGMFLTFACTVIAWVFFRAPSITDALRYLKGMASSSILKPSHLFDPWLAGLIVVLLAVEWIQRDKQHGLQVGHLPAWARRVSYASVFLLIFFFGRFAKTAFIYFQF
jgi:D-alanyl-lipoteichoic acid acyltransferase DltB (MBOAT superfamily)